MTSLAAVCWSLSVSLQPAAGRSAWADCEPQDWGAHVLIVIHISTF